MFEDRKGVQPGWTDHAEREGEKVRDTRGPAHIGSVSSLSFNLEGQNFKKLSACFILKKTILDPVCKVKRRAKTKMQEPS